MAVIRWVFTVVKIFHPAPPTAQVAFNITRVNQDTGERDDRRTLGAGVTTAVDISVVAADIVAIDEYDVIKDYVIAYYDSAGNHLVSISHRIHFATMPSGLFDGDLKHTQVHFVGVAPTPTPTPPPTLPPVPPTPERPAPPTIEEPVEVQPPDQPPKPLPPYQPPKPPEHPPFQPPPPIPERPPRFSPRETDTQTFLRFLERWGHQIDEYTINVPLDSGLWVEQLEEPWRSLWAKLTEHKADLVFKRKGQLYVAEVKPRLSRGAIGEALVAAQMYEMIYKPPQKPQPAVVCMTASPILLQMAAHNGVLVFVTDSIDGSKLWGEVRTRRKVR